MNCTHGLTSNKKLPPQPTVNELQRSEDNLLFHFTFFFLCNYWTLSAGLIGSLPANSTDIGHGLIHILCSYEFFWEHIDNVLQKVIVI